MTTTNKNEEKMSKAEILPAKNGTFYIKMNGEIEAKNIENMGIAKSIQKIIESQYNEFLSKILELA